MSSTSLVQAGAAHVSAADPLIGTQIDGRYVIERIQGRGGTSIVYAGIHEELQSEVAIKVLDPASAADPLALERFALEARLGSSLAHGNVVGVSDYGHLPDGRPYLVMPMVAGIDMATLLAQEGPQHPRRVAKLLNGVASALSLMHARGLVHRDIKSENLMYVAHEDGTETALVLDFGIAAARVPDAEAYADSSGTPEFMPPEAMSGHIADYRGDIYALATVAFELITGSLPFEGEDVTELRRKKTTEAARGLAQAGDREFPAELEAVLARGLARRPEERHASAGEFISALRAAAEPMEEWSQRPPMRRPVSVHPTLVGTGSGVRDRASVGVPVQSRATTLAPASTAGTPASTPATLASMPLASASLASTPLARTTLAGTSLASTQLASPPATLASTPLASTSLASTPPASTPGTLATKPARMKTLPLENGRSATLKRLSERAANFSSSTPAPPPLGAQGAPPLHLPAPLPLPATLRTLVEQAEGFPRHEASPDGMGASTEAPLAISASPASMQQVPRLRPELVTVARAADLDFGDDPFHRQRRGLQVIVPAALLCSLVLGLAIWARTRPAASPVVSAANAVAPMRVEPSPAPAPPATPPPAAPAVVAPEPMIAAAAAPAEPVAKRDPDSVATDRSKDSHAASSSRASRSSSSGSNTRHGKSSASPVVQITKKSDADARPAPTPSKPASSTASKPASSAPSKSASATPSRTKSESARALTDQATDATLRSDFAAASSLYQQAIAADPSYAPAWRGKALVLERTGHAHDAATAFRQFLKLAPNGAAADKIRERLKTLEAAQ